MKLYCKTCGKKTDVDLLVTLDGVGNFQGNDYAILSLVFNCSICGSEIRKSENNEIYLDNTYYYVEFEDV